MGVLCRCDAGQVGERRAFGAADGVGRRGRVEDVEAGGAEGGGVVAEDAGSAEAVEDAAVADVVKEAGGRGVVAVGAAGGGGRFAIHRRSRGIEWAVEID